MRIYVMNATETILVSILLSVSAGTALAQRHSIDPICGECVVEQFASCGGFLEGASFDRSGQLWVVDLLSGNVLQVGSSGDCSIVANTGGAPNGSVDIAAEGLAFPNGIALSPS
ncbi:MAG: hypothetical protein PVF63_06685 [Gammaproteobacteria bacterium]|jgi:sugar lactone lactonase YvrE